MVSANSSMPNITPIGAVQGWGAGPKNGKYGNDIVFKKCHYMPTNNQSSN